MQYSKSLDGIRGIAVILVILFHCRYLIIGWVGVQLFYVLSGYLITSILIESRYKLIGEYLSVFYVRRLLRIFPLYFMFIFILYIINMFYIIPYFNDNLFWLLTYTYNIKRMYIGDNISYWFTHLWSLAVEEQFYLIWPFVIYFINTKKLKHIFIIIILLTPLIRYFMVYFASNYNNTEYWLGSLVYNFTLTQADAFSYGAVLTQLNLQTLNRLGSLFIPTTIIVTLIGVLLKLQSIPELAINNIVLLTGLSIGHPEGLVSSYFKHVWCYSLINIISMMFIAYAISNNNIVLNNKFIVHTGKISYGIYIFHLPLLAIYEVNYNITYNLILTLSYLATLYIISTLSFNYYELPFLKLKQKFSYQRAS